MTYEFHSIPSICYDKTNIQWTKDDFNPQVLCTLKVPEYKIKQTNKQINIQMIEKDSYSSPQYIFWSIC